MRNLKKINSTSEIVEQEYGVCYKTANDVYVKQPKKKPNIVLYYNDGTKQEYPDATLMSSSLISSETNLVKAELNNGVINIGSDAFSNCSKLNSITIPNSVRGIGPYAFFKCTGLTSITIPDSVTSIGYFTFSDCISLTSISYNGTMTQWNTITKGISWKNNVPTTCIVHCTDGDISIVNA